mmetsp:Transcript_14023/g.38756  ORF Transcript_14023/g.38756 Transcript_14023/m.38756 type:complete len:305 (+) Transcript_14023:717-1631(+)
MVGLCHATQYNSLLVTTGNTVWNDRKLCPSKIGQQHQQYRGNGTTPLSPLWCYFSYHESGLRCPFPKPMVAGNDSSIDSDAVTTPTSVDWDHIPKHKASWGGYDCRDILATANRSWDGMLPSAAEWLIQNVSNVVIDEAERQLLREAFPDFRNSTAVATDGGRGSFSDHDGDHQPCYKYPPSQLVTVHIRWGDKYKEMKNRRLVPITKYIEAVQTLLTKDASEGRTIVFIYLASEDPNAIQQFRLSAPSHWSVNMSGPTNPYGNSRRTMMSAASTSKGRAGLESLAALLISMEANRYVLTGASN